ncbi:MAG: metallopeptidase family protein [Anaerolineae bacterium]|nr:metallopeptidase family protein [Anaerolineae bacterium]
MVIDRATFERLVAEAVETLPAAFRDSLENVDIVTEAWPSPAVLAKAGHRHPAELLGFYEGVPQTRRTRHYGLVLPDKISLFRGPIAMRCHSLAEVQALVERVLRHEIAHHFGIDDDRLRELDAY